MARKTNFQPAEPDDDRPGPVERPHKILKVPGLRGAEWNQKIGRWVIYRRSVSRANLRPLASGGEPPIEDLPATTTGTPGV